MERRLGRGLGALLPAQDSPDDAPPANAEIEIARITPNPHQPRSVFDEEGLAELRASIERHGVLQPIVVRPAPGAGRGSAPRYELISGERRWRASKLAGKRTIPAVVREEVGEDEMLELALVENVQRRDLDPIERARGYRQLIERLELTQEEVAERVGLQRSTVANHLRLLELPDTIQDAVGQGLLSMGHARALLGARDPSAQEALLTQVVRGDLSVRETEKRVRDLQRAKSSERRPAKSGTREPWMDEIERRLRERLGTKVRLVNGSGVRGQIVLEYYDQPGLEALLETLAPARQLQ